MVAAAVAALDADVKVHTDHFDNGNGGCANVKFCGH